MNLLSIENISKSYSERALFKEVSLGIDEGDKIGIIGVNGTGKSTFLKVIAGVEVLDAGRILMANKVNIEYLPQNPEFDEEATVLEQIFKGDSTVMQLLRQYEIALEDLQRSSGEEILQRKLLSLNVQMDAMNAWQIESEAKAVLTKLGISNFNSKIGTLSGGQKKRVALAASLISPAELLILDEPTNHIDDESVEWLEQYLNKRKGALLMITHDRYFLDRVSNKIIELDKGRLFSYEGNYSNFLEKKIEREELEQSMERKRKSLFVKELAWIRKGAKARTTKQKARIDRFDKLGEDKIELNTNKLEMSSVSTRLGKKIIEIENISKSFGKKKVIDNFSHIMVKGDRIGIIGANGTGKSTLVNIIAGIIKPDSGTIEKGQTVNIGYFTQGNEELDGDLRVIDYIKQIAEYLETADGEKISASQMLERFLFEPSVQYTPIARLSGGEKRRLFLLNVLMGAPNILLLDEPTNDLDIQTLTILEDYLEGFNGVVILVSHDRYFLDRVAEKILIFKENGVIDKYVGNYSDYCAMKSNKCEDAAEEKTYKQKEQAKNLAEETKKVKPIKFTYKEQLEFDEIDSIIEIAEEKLFNINKKLSATGSDFELIQKLLEEQAKANKELEHFMGRWEYLNELDEKIKEQ
jgi:ATP-binding cassette subfamily F protein uup